MSSKKPLNSKKSVNWANKIKDALEENGIRSERIIWIPFPITDELLAEDDLIESSFIEAWASDRVEDALPDRYLVLDITEESHDVVVLNVLGGVTLNQIYQLPFVLYNYELVYGIEDAFKTAKEIIEDIKVIQ